MDDGNVDSVNTSSANLQGLFTDFCAAHDAYVLTLTDGDAIETSVTYYDEVFNKYRSTMRQVRTFMASPEQATEPQHPHSDSAVTSSLVQALNLPRLEIAKFSGDVRDYHTFMTVFKQCVESVTTDGHTRLSQLLYHTKGEAYNAIKSCLGEGGDAGYALAMKRLRTRFGSPHVICETVMSDLKRHPDAHTAADLRQFADELTTASDVLKEHSMYAEIDTQNFILSMCMKLQLRVRYKWRNRAADKLHDTEAYPRFCDFVAFVARQADVLNDPVYGGDALFDSNQKHSRTPSAPSTRKVSSYTTTAKRTMCMLCDKDHRLFRCPDFMNRTLGERISYVTDNKLCNVCLSQGHVTNDCIVKYKCPVTDCNAKHSKLIHVDTTSSNCGNTSVGLNVNCHSSVLMPVLPITVNGVYNTHALLDTGSSHSFCSGRLKNELRLSGPKMKFDLNTLSSTAQVESQMVEFEVASRFNSRTTSMNNVRVIDSIPVQTASCDVSNYPHLEGLHCPGDVQVDILIGQDYPALLKPIDVRSGREDEPFAVLSTLGWTLNGPVPSILPHKRVTSHLVSSALIEQKLDKLWQMECIEDGNSLSPLDVRVLELWDKECAVVDDHFQLPIPWKNPDAMLPNNLFLAESRLKSLKKSLDRKNITQQYDTEICKLLSSGYAEPVPDNVMTRRCFYIPHHAVAKHHDKIRVVFDCASKCNDISLNNLCLQGPNLTSKIFDILIRFRQFLYAVTADITAMYNQVRIPPSDRDALRFLWTDGGVIKHYRMTSHLFGGVWCSSSSAYALNKTADLTPNPQIKDIITKSFYVDDLLWSTSSIDAAKLQMPNVKSVLSQRGFQLTKFVATHDDMLSGISPDSRLRNEDQKILCHSDKALGVGWCLTTDSLYVKHNLRPVSTKAEMLSSLASVFDPLGLVVPLHLIGKVIFQDTTDLKLSWDSKLPDDLISRWNQWIVSMGKISSLTIDRCLIPISFQDSYYELHAFCDASQRAYGCAIYIRCSNKEGKIHTALVCSKSRLCPRRAVTIPRLELQAAVLAVKLESSLRKAFSVSMPTSYFWSDSAIALAYIKNESKRFHTFVCNRVATIRNVSNPDQWHHVPGNQNPADLASRGVQLKALDTQLWHKGPAFSRLHKDAWPVHTILTDVPEDNPEVKKMKTVVLCIDASVHPIDKLCNYFSSWHKVKRAVAWLLKIRTFLRTRPDRHIDQLSVDDVLAAETIIFKHVQQIYFKKDIALLTSGMKLVGQSPLKKLDPILNHDGVLVAGGRLAHSTLPDAMKYPIILPYDHILSTLLIRDIHARCHLGREWILSLTRKKYWIIKGRSLVYKVVSDCITCKRLFSKTCVQKMANLPEPRVNFDKNAFDNVSVDCFGPFHVKRGRREYKRYGCIFTCLNIRAIHIEKLDDLECDTYINSMRRFIARRGKPSKMFSDNGTNFTSAEAELRRAVKQLDIKAIEKYCTFQEIEWFFHPPTASHMNGACERMIRTVRKVLTGMLTDKCRLTDDILNTLFAEVEGIINHRPLTKVSDDVADDRALTPSHLLMVRSSPQISPGNFTQGDMYRRRWRYTQHLADVFWRRYLNEYLPELQRRNKWQNMKRNLKVGDLVLIMHENTPRRLWPLGLVVLCQEGRDGMVRSARVKTQSTELVRPISKLILLEA